MKKVFLLCLAVLVLFTGCFNENAVFNSDIAVTVVSREDGSGTRSAFRELFDLNKKVEDTKIDTTTMESIIVNGTAIVMTMVAGDPYAIGYISLGSLNDSIKPLAIDGVMPTVENIQNGTYKISRSFLIATTGSISPESEEFITYILSEQGQEIVTENGYVPLKDTAPYKGSTMGGKVVVAGSSSVTPVMEKLKEAYQDVNPNMQIEIQQSDSSSGLNAASSGICDIAMSSRKLTDNELSSGLVPMEIAHDGIVVIVNKGNPSDTLSAEQVRRIFTGEATTWREVETA